MGKRALWIGGIAQSLPDIDVVSAGWLDGPSALLAHRGFTHSLFFVIILSLGLAWITGRFRPLQKIGFSAWTLFFAVQLGVHLFLDLMNCYGEGLLEPFSHHRFSLNILYVADPFLSLWPVVAAFILLLTRSASPRRRRWARLGWIGASIYLLYAGYNKLAIERSLTPLLRAQGLSNRGRLTTPAPFNTWLWYIVIPSDSGYYIGYRSVFDRTSTLPLRFVPKQEALWQQVPPSFRGQPLLRRFAQETYVLEQRGDTILFEAVRFGQTAGWQHPANSFVFQYSVSPPGVSNRMPLQRGRLAEWDWTALRALVERIQGKAPE